MEYGRPCSFDSNAQVKVVDLSQCQVGWFAHSSKTEGCHVKVSPTPTENALMEDATLIAQKRRGTRCLRDLKSSILQTGRNLCNRFGEPRMMFPDHCHCPGCHPTHP